MKFLIIGDVCGKTGRKMINEHVKSLKKKHEIDFVICNGENSAHGKGITKKIYQQLLENGVDCITMGNHTFSKSDINNFIDEANKMIVPYNFPNNDKGQGTAVFHVKGKRVRVTNLLGSLFMGFEVPSAFEAFKEIIKNQTDEIHIVDFHGETTSEKIAFAYHFSDHLSCLVGTHTHVQTADETILLDKTAFISDLGMCGCVDSILGRDINEAISKFISNEKTRYTIAEGRGIFCALIVEIDEKTNKAIKVERIRIVE